MTNWVEGQVTAYDVVSGVLTINATLVNGTGSFVNWTVGLAGERGQQGPQGPAGAGSGDMLKSENLAGLTDYNAARNNMQLAAVAHSGDYNDLSNLPGTQRSVTAGPISLAAADEIINCNIATGTPTCALPASASRNGRLVVFKDVGGQWGAHNLTITPAGTEKIDGMANIVGRSNYGRIALRPMNDGVNNGWSLEA
jgi:hypothetical protein